MIKLKYFLMVFLGILFISLNAIGSAENSFTFTQEDFNLFKNKYGDWQLTDDFNSVNLQGQNIPLSLNKEINKEIIESSVRNFIDDNGNLLKINENELKTTRVVNNNDEWNLKFEQEHNGVKVYNSKVIISIKNNNIVKIKSSFYNNINIDTKPSISKKEVKDLALNYLGKKAQVEDIQLFVYPITEKGNNFFRLAYRVVFSDMFEEKPVKYVYFIDAKSKELFKIENAIREAAIQGSVTGPYIREYPSQGYTTTGFEDEEVRVNTFSVFTNETGAYYRDGLSGTVNLLFKLKGRYVDVNNLERTESSHSRSITVPNTYNVNWNNYDISYQKEESNVYYHVNKLRDYFNSGGALNFNELDFVSTANVGFGPSYCGAFSNGITITFSRLYPGVCNSLALSSDIIYHEYTHNLVYGVYGIFNIPGPEGGSLNEALADYFAASVNGNPIIAEEVYYGLPGGRTIDTDLFYPIDLMGEAHQDGYIISGAWWDLRQTLGMTLTDNLMGEALRLEPSTYEQFLIDVLIADDNNGNLNDGTPNINAICNAFYDRHTIYSEYCRGRTNGPIAHLTYPLHDQRVFLGQNELYIAGTVWGSRTSPLNYYKIEYQFYNDPPVLIAEGNTPLINGILTNWNISNLPQGEYKLILTTRTQNNVVQTYRIMVNLFDVNLDDAAITCDSHPCIASSDLIRSRGFIDIPEYRYPNTVDECTDGNFGQYLVEQSVEEIKVENLDNSQIGGVPVFLKGDLVQVTMRIWCGQLSDQLVIAYMADPNNPTWVQEARTYCYGVQNQFYNYSTTFNLDDREGYHVIRALVGDYTDLGTFCGDWLYDDNDDVVINVVSEPRGGSGSPMFLKAIPRNIDREN